jgi:hypothetical protein
MAGRIADAKETDRAMRLALDFAGPLRSHSAG